MTKTEQNHIQSRTSIESPLGTQQRNVPFVSFKAACKILEISPSLLYKATHQRTIKHYKNGRKLYFKFEDLEEYILNKDNYVPTLREAETQARQTLKEIENKKRRR